MPFLFVTVLQKEADIRRIAEKNEEYKISNIHERSSTEKGKELIWIFFDISDAHFRCYLAWDNSIFRRHSEAPMRSTTHSEQSRMSANVRGVQTEDNRQIFRDKYNILNSRQEDLLMSY